MPIGNAEDVFAVGDQIFVRRLGYISRDYQGKLGIVIRWVFEQIYEVEIEGNLILLSASEMLHER